VNLGEFRVPCMSLHLGSKCYGDVDSWYVRCLSHHFQ